MGKVNGLFQDAEEQAFDRYTNILVVADVEVMFQGGSSIAEILICDIPCVWVWDESSREAAEYWAVLNYINENYTYDWMSVKSWCGTPVFVEKTNG